MWLPFRSSRLIAVTTSDGRWQFSTRHQQPSYPLPGRPTRTGSRYAVPEGDRWLNAPRYRSVSAANPTSADRDVLPNQTHCQQTALSLSLPFSQSTLVRTFLDNTDQTNRHVTAATFFVEPSAKFREISYFWYITGIIIVARHSYMQRNR